MAVIQYTVYAGPLLAFTLQLPQQTMSMVLLHWICVANKRCSQISHSIACQAHMLSRLCRKNERLLTKASIFENAVRKSLILGERQDISHF